MQTIMFSILLRDKNWMTRRKKKKKEETITMAGQWNAHKFTIAETIYAVAYAA